MIAGIPVVALAILVASFAVSLAALVVRGVVLRRLDAERRAAVQATARLARRWLLPAVPVFAIAFYVALQHAPQHLLAVAFVSIAYSGAVGTLRFVRLLRLDLPLAYQLAWGIDMAASHFGLAAYLWYVRAFFV
jgi:hypothetical protein